MEYCSCVADPVPVSNLSLAVIRFLESSNASTLADEEPGWTRAVRVLKSTMSVGAIVMNVMSLLAISLSRSVMSANVRFVCSLALADLLCGVCGFLDDESIATVLSCSRRTSKCLLVMSHLSALLTIFGLAVDHYLAICKPLYHRSDVNIFRVNIVIVLIWIFSVVGSLVDVFAEVNICTNLLFSRPY